MTETISNYDFTTMLEEAQSKLERQYASMKTLREHGKLLLGSSSVIVSLFTLFKITSTQIKQDYMIYYLLIIGIMAISYVLLMCFSIMATLPYPLIHAIDPTWETYVQAFKDETPRVILERRVYAYLKAIEHNEKTLIKQYEISKKLNVYMIVVVVAIIVLATLIPFMQA